MNLLVFDIQSLQKLLRVQEEKDVKKKAEREKKQKLLETLKEQAENHRIAMKEAEIERLKPSDDIGWWSSQQHSNKHVKEGLLLGASFHSCSEGAN